MSKPHWRPARACDLAAISAIAARIHPDLFGRPEAFAEKIRLCTDGARVLAAEEAIVGYGLAYPWKQHQFRRSTAFSNDCLTMRIAFMYMTSLCCPTPAAVWHALMSRRSRNSRARRALRLSRWSQSTPRDRYGNVSAFGPSRRMRS
ncbi:hypothetical protein ACVW17_000016 [Bradyrhizobium sp. USDA 4473]